MINFLVEICIWVGIILGLGKVLVDICDNELLLLICVLFLDIVFDSGVLVCGWYVVMI